VQGPKRAYRRLPAAGQRPDPLDEALEESVDVRLHRHIHVRRAAPDAPPVGDRFAGGEPATEFNLDGDGLGLVFFYTKKKFGAWYGGAFTPTDTVGIVTKVVKDKVAAQVEIQAGPHRFVSLITREAVDELQLVPGMVVDAVVKATNVGVEIPAQF